MHSHLPSIHSMEEAKFLDELSRNDPRLPWIGLKLENDHFEWSDGSVLNFIFWASGEPNNKDNIENCTQMRTTAYYKTYKPSEVIEAVKWNDFTCTGHAETFFCKKTLPSGIPECDYSLVKCPRGWIRFCKHSMHCHCYLHIKEKVHLNYLCCSR